MLEMIGKIVNVYSKQKWTYYIPLWDVWGNWEEIWVCIIYADTLATVSKIAFSEIPKFWSLANSLRCDTVSNALRIFKCSYNIRHCLVSFNLK